MRTCRTCHAAGVFMPVMSYNLTLQCSCLVYVACDPRTRVAHARVIETKGARCSTKRHEVGFRLFLWEILPDPACQPRAVFVSDGSHMTRI